MSAVAYLGPEGTFSHILARRRFGKKASFMPCPTIDAVFEAVKSDPKVKGVVPVENSSGGTVYDTTDLLIRHAGAVWVREELSLDIRIALLGHAGGQVKTVYSHFTQIRHHSDWLGEKYPKARLRAVTSTAIAAQQAAASPNAAALASPGAAEIYGLRVLELPGGGEEVNVTHFFTIAASPAPVSASKSAKTAFVAMLPNESGSLHRFLGPFARAEVSLTRIISRPVPGKPQTYVFFIEIDGDPSMPPVSAALDRATRIAETINPLGSFPTLPRYKS